MKVAVTGVRKIKAPDFMEKGALTILNNWDFNEPKIVEMPINEQHSDIEAKLHRLELENLELKLEVEYYQKYIEFLKENYIFQHKNIDWLKVEYEKTGDINDKHD